jgi:AraC-like DNA-binding protein
MSKIEHFSTIREYCRGIQISPPRYERYDIRSFEENMPMIRPQMPPFKHEFYAIALKLEGGGFATTGHFDTKDLQATIFFNSPYQVTSWDIVPDWVGYYIIFTEAFYRQDWHKKRITEQYPFLLNDHSSPMPIDAEESDILYKTFRSIYSEHHKQLAHREEIILHYINILLLKTARIYYKSAPKEKVTTHHRDHDLELVARFRTLVEISFYPNKSHGGQSPHQVQYYADLLNIHPNHLNALVRRITDHSASEFIQQHVINLAKSKLKNKVLTVKEIAYDLYFNYPNHFSSFFKKQAGISPNAYRNQ